MANIFTLKTPNGLPCEFNEQLLIRASYHNRGNYSLIAIDGVDIDPINIKGIADKLDAIIGSSLNGTPIVLNKPEIDFEYAMTLDSKALDLYAAKFNIKLDGRQSVDNMLIEFAGAVGHEFEYPTDETETTVVEDVSEIETKDGDDSPTDLVCPHCGAKARTIESYNKNHGDNCFKV